MAVLRRQWKVSVLVIAMAAGIFLLWGRKIEGHTPGDETISAPTTFASLDNGIHDADPTVGKVEIDGNLTIANGGSITCNDPAAPSGSSACDIDLTVTGTLEIQAGGSIDTQNLVGGGHGGAIHIVVGGDFIMRGPSSGHPGAKVTSEKRGNGTDSGGDITIVVGGVTLDTSVSPAIGICGTPTGNILVESGATVTSDAVAFSGTAGDIALYAGHDITINGSVHAEGFQGGGHGGAITIDACCNLLVGDTGRVRSAGRDPGADRVHLEACTVTVFGIVESTAPGHENPTPNCTPPIRPGKPANSTACVEIWSGTTLVIDSTGTHHGQVNADVGMSGGTSGGSWIDVLANGDITITGNTTLPYNSGGDINNNALVTPAWAVHANMALQNGHGGDIAVQSKSGNVTTDGRAIQANSSTGSNGGKGGHVKVEADLNLAFGDASVQAMGDTTGGGSQQGGTITGRAFNGSLTGVAPGQLDAAGPGGNVTLESCPAAPPYTGSINATTSSSALVPGLCGNSPTFPSPADTLLPAATCAQTCVPQTTTPTRTAGLPTITPTPGGFCNKSTVLAVLNGRVPDVVVRTDLGESIQAAIDAASVPGFDAAHNNDGFIIIGVVTNAFGNLGGNANQRVTISQVYEKPFLLFGCSVTLHDPDKGDGLPTGLITAGAGSPGNIFVMDLHGADSDVAGWKVEGNGRTLRNVATSGNTQAGVWLVGDGNTMHNGNGTNNPGVGILVSGNSNTVDSADAFGNGSHGVEVTGNNNQILKVDTGEIGKGNGGDGVNVSGTPTTLSEITSRSNSGNGFKVTSSGNTLTKNDSGGTASQNNTGCEFDVAAGNTNGGQNTANGVTVVGNPFPTGCIN